MKTREVEHDELLVGGAWKNEHGGNTSASPQPHRHNTASNVNSFPRGYSTSERLETRKRSVFEYSQSCYCHVAFFIHYYPSSPKDTFKRDSTHDDLN
jgi:hypothetical protein